MADELTAFSRSDVKSWAHFRKGNSNKSFRVSLKFGGKYVYEISHPLGSVLVCYSAVFRP
jgi:hypothetical protein